MLSHTSASGIMATVLAAFTFLLAFAPSAVSAQELKRRTQLRVVDANGKKVGRVFGLAGTALTGVRANPWGIVGAFIPGASGVLVAFQVTEHPPFVVGVGPDRFTGNSPLLFASTDCSGTPFLQDSSSTILVGADLRGYSWPDSGSLLPPVAIASPGQTVYIPDPAAPPQSIVESSILTDGTCNPIGGSPPTNLRPALPLINLDRFFTPPFGIR